MKNIRQVVGLVTLAMLIASTSALSMDKNDRFRVVGDFSCSQVLDNSNTAKVVAYVQGFATATNIWLEARKDHFKGMPAIDMVNWVISKCRENRLSTLGSSLTTLVSELTSAK